MGRMVMHFYLFIYLFFLRVFIERKLPNWYLFKQGPFLIHYSARFVDNGCWSATFSDILVESWQGRGGLPDLVDFLRPPYM